MQVLPELRNGNLLKEITDALHQATEAVRETQGTAKVQITLTLKQGQGAYNALVINDSVKVSLPKLKNLGSIFFHDSEGNLTRNNPDQLELQGIAIVRAEPKIEKVDMETGEEMKLQPSEYKENYKKSIATYFENLKLKFGQQNIDFVSMDINEGIEIVLQKYLIKRQKMGI